MAGAPPTPSTPAHPAASGIRPPLAAIIPPHPHPPDARTPHPPTFLPQPLPACPFPPPSLRCWPHRVPPRLQPVLTLPPSLATPAIAPSHIDLTPTAPPFSCANPTPPPPPSSTSTSVLPCLPGDGSGRTLLHSLLLCLPGNESGQILLHLRPPVPARRLEPPTPPFSRASRSRIQQDPPSLLPRLPGDGYGGILLQLLPLWRCRALCHPLYGRAPAPHKPSTMDFPDDDARRAEAQSGSTRHAVRPPPPTPTSLATACPRLIPLRLVLSVMGSAVLFYHFAAHLLVERRTVAATTSVGAAGEFAVALLPLDITGGSLGSSVKYNWLCKMLQCGCGSTSQRHKAHKMKIPFAVARSCGCAAVCSQAIRLARP